MNKAKDLARKLRNEELLRKMQAGENLKYFDSQASFFPPRPVIKKLTKELERVYPDVPG